MDIYVIQYKHCKKCDTLKSKDYFSKDKHHKDGLQSRCKSCVKEYKEKNKQKLKEYKKNYIKSKRENDILLNIRDHICRGINKALSANGYTKNSKTYEILGCSYDEFKIHIEQQFLKGMSWDNRSKWHLDHIIPLSFACTEDEILKVSHYSNFRPMWAKDNIIKRNTLTECALNHPIYKEIIQARIV